MLISALVFRRDSVPNLFLMRLHLICAEFHGIEISFHLLKNIYLGCKWFIILGPVSLSVARKGKM